MILLRRIVKAHVSAYDRVSKTGALSHIREHEDSRVRSYARKILGSKNSYDLYTIKRDRFGHLPHWNKLDEHTRQAVLDAEEEKTKGHRDFEEWVEKHGSKKGTKKDSEKVDRSGWEQQMMFKSHRVRHVAYILRKSYHSRHDFGERGHVAFTRRVKSGKLSLISEKGMQKIKDRTELHKYQANKPTIDEMPFKTINASMMLPKVLTKDRNNVQMQKDYMNRFLNVFGASVQKSAEFTDVTGTRLNISTRMFKDRKHGGYKIFKDGREQALLLLADTLKDPTEIWESNQVRSGKQVKVRHYVAMYKTPSGKTGGLAVFDIVGGRWDGTTIHSIKDIGTGGWRDDYLENARQGKLAYRKKIG